ncbi:MAG TPA: hypothetical protein DCZ95_12505 [Verrucomicrobia bacterium]|nr:hypothetical protein [Verrucomicrobiota bacterium]
MDVCDDAAAISAAHTAECIDRARRRNLPVGESARHCDHCGSKIPVARRRIIPGVRLCVPCQEKEERHQ